MIVKAHTHNYIVNLKDILDITPYLNENTFFVIDKNVYDLYISYFTKIKSEYLFLLDAAENTKTLDTVVKICDAFTKISAKKNAVLVSLGGGITQDVTGFVANILYRGINWIFFPTTLLAACDSCIGSKTSLNFKNYKNLLGTFYPPKEIIIVPEFFKTLSKYDLASGLGEIVKFNVMRGAKSIEKLELDLEKLINIEIDTVKQYILNSLKFKQPFIEKDEFDNKERVMLNFAHTFGHAIETASNYLIPHGTAVALGMLIANRLSVQKNMLSEEISFKITELIKRIVFIDINCVDFKKIISAVKNDKKQISEKIRAILIDNNFNLSIQYLGENEINEAFTYVWDIMQKI